MQFYVLIVLLVSSGAISEDTHCKSGIEDHVEFGNATNYFQFRKDLFEGSSWHQIYPREVHHQKRFNNQHHSRYYSNYSTTEENIEYRAAESHRNKYNRRDMKGFVDDEKDGRSNGNKNKRRLHIESHFKPDMSKDSSESDESGQQILSKAQIADEYNGRNKRPGGILNLKRWASKLKKIPRFSGHIERKNFFQDIIDSIFGKKPIPIATTTKPTTKPTNLPIGWLNTQDGHIPTKAFEAGRAHGLLIYVVRTVNTPAMPGFIPGNLRYGDMGGGHCAMGFFRMRRIYQILLGDVEDFRWVKMHTQGEEITKHRSIVQAGWEGTPNNPLYVCRGLIDLTMTIGKLTKEAVCFAGSYLNGLEWVIEDDVEVLVKKEIPPSELWYERGPELEQ